MIGSILVDTVRKVFILKCVFLVMIVVSTIFGYLF